MENTNKEYGLIFPNKNKGHQIGQVTAKPSIFQEDSDSDTPAYKPTGISKGVKKQDAINQEKAVEDDPTVYQYDEIYDEMDQKRKESKLSRKDLDRKPKYINRLLLAAEKRKRENERRIERQVQKEREEEGEMYKDKESFITSAYKKKLEEMKELEEQEKREEYLESIGDVRKQGNLDGFYRHLYDQKVNYEDKDTDSNKPPVKEEPRSDEDIERTAASEIQERDSMPKSPGSEHEESPPKKRRKSSTSQSENEKFDRKRETKQRKYRTRRQSEETDKSDDDQGIKKEHMPSNLDADSDFSIDSSDSDEEAPDKTQKKQVKENLKSEGKSETALKEENVEKGSEHTNMVPETTEKYLVKEEPQEVKPKEPKVDIWKKVTVGEKYDEAVKRYYERKALRQMEGICF